MTWVHEATKKQKKTATEQAFTFHMSLGNILSFIYCYIYSTNLFYLISFVQRLEIIVLWTILLSVSKINFSIICYYY